MIVPIKHYNVINTGKTKSITKLFLAFCTREKYSLLMVCNVDLLIFISSYVIILL